jgi:hypothetical protein
MIFFCYCDTVEPLLSGSVYGFPSLQWLWHPKVDNPRGEGCTRGCRHKNPIETPDIGDDAPEDGADGAAFLADAAGQTLHVQMKVVLQEKAEERVHHGIADTVDDDGGQEDQIDRAQAFYLQEECSQALPNALPAGHCNWPGRASIQGFLDENEDEQADEAEYPAKDKVGDKVGCFDKVPGKDGSDELADLLLNSSLLFFNIFSVFFSSVMLKKEMIRNSPVSTLKYPIFCGQNFLDTQNRSSYTPTSKKEFLSIQ